MSKVVKVLLWLGVVLVLIVCTLAGVYAYNRTINQKVVLTKYNFEHSEIPETFDGFKILMISDLHNAPFSQLILEHIADSRPDIIVFTGDMAQLPDDNISETLKIAKGVQGKIPIYAVSGNHEIQNKGYWDITCDLWDNGIYCLEDDSVAIERGEDSFLLVGLADPEHDFLTSEQYADACREIDEEFPDGPCFSVLLNHRADMYPKIKDTRADLILSGHLHGGVVRLPFVGGVIGETNEVTFPKYDYGYYKEGDSAAMIVSGGCDLNPKKMRFFNSPEVVLITLKAK